MPRRPRKISEPGPRLSLLLDTNIILDVLLARSPWDQEATQLLNAIAHGEALGHVAAHAVTTAHYIVERARSRAIATSAVADLLQLLAVVPLDNSDFQRALTLGVKDFEDAVHAAACLRVGAHFLVTRNHRDYRGTAVETRSAGEVIAHLRALPRG